MQVTIIPITKARSKLGDLTDKVTKSRFIILTKGGSPKAALVDYNYFEKLKGEVEKMYQKTFLTPSISQFTREFSKQEIDEWLKEDKL